jgi:FdhD protein
VKDQLAVEEPLEIRVDTRPIAVTLRTPGHDRELAAGFLLSEGILRSARDLKTIRPFARNSKGNVIDVFLADSVPVDFDRLTRHVFASSSCGLCGKATIDSVHQQFPPLPPPPSQTRARKISAQSSALNRAILISQAELARLPDRMRRHQSAFRRTGGLHAAALFDSGGNLLILREDVGRHNAVDKVLGHGLLNERLPWDRHVLLVSGRASFEIVQKALAARIPVIAAISAPSSLAVDFARDSRQTLVGFLRDGSMNIYSHPTRIGTNP